MTRHDCCQKNSIVRALRVGLTGGIGSGKSAVAEVWRERGAFIIDADLLAREAVARGSAGLAAIAQRWPQVVNVHGELDRVALGNIVFNSKPDLDALNAIVHPQVRALAEAREAQSLTATIVVHVVPLLFEGEYWRWCDVTVVVIAAEETRVARVVARDTLDAPMVRARIRAQIDPRKARSLATYVIENDGDLGALRAAANEVYAKLEERSRSR